MRTFPENTRLRAQKRAAPASDLSKHHVSCRFAPTRCSSAGGAIWSIPSFGRTVISTRSQELKPRAVRTARRRTVRRGHPLRRVCDAKMQPTLARRVPLLLPASREHCCLFDFGEAQSFAHALLSSARAKSHPSKSRRVVWRSPRQCLRPKQALLRLICLLVVRQIAFRAAWNAKRRAMTTCGESSLRYRHSALTRRRQQLLASKARYLTESLTVSLFQLLFRHFRCLIAANCPTAGEESRGMTAARWCDWPPAEP